MISLKVPCSACGELCAEIVVAESEGKWAYKIIGFEGDETFYLEEAQANRLGKLVRKGSVVELSRVDNRYAPFYCEECRLSYCYKHWSPVLKFDEDWPVWYDATYGTCPKGHKKMIGD